MKNKQVFVVKYLIVIVDLQKDLRETRAWVFDIWIVSVLDLVFQDERLILKVKVN